jgi:hypothetical protein
VKEWEKEERRLARRRGGVRQPGSGSGWRRRGDVREPTILWEQKTASRSITLTEEMWETHRRRALLEGVTPKIHITLGRKKRRLVLIEEAEDEANDPPYRP